MSSSWPKWRILVKSIFFGICFFFALWYYVVLMQNILSNSSPLSFKILSTIVSVIFILLMITLFVFDLIRTKNNRYPKARYVIYPIYIVMPFLWFLASVLWRILTKGFTGFLF